MDPEKKKILTLVVMAGIVVSLLVGFLMMSCGTGYTYQDDNIAEELAEEALKAKTGLDVDFSPGTPETGFSPRAIAPVTKTK